MVITRSQLKLNQYQYQRTRLFRTCRISLQQSSSEHDDEIHNWKIYAARVKQNDQFVKFGASRDLTRRMTDLKFGKAPSRIARYVKDPANRICVGYFRATPRARLSGLQVERRFHSQKEEMKIVGEWYLSRDIEKAIHFFESYGYEFVSLM